MNTSIFFRVLTKTSRYCTTTQHIIYASTALQQLTCKRMSTNVSTMSQAKEKETFQDILPCIIDSLVSSQKLAEVPEVGSWIKKVLEYNLAGGKKNRGLSTVFAYEMLKTPENITGDSMRLARIMGWCVEMLQAYLLVADDMMDGSTTRRGVPCWYRLPEVGLGAINDSILIYTSMFEILKIHFGKLLQYSQIVDLFNETVLYTSIGQHLDYTTAHHNKNDYSLFTVDRYEAIVKYKTAYYSYRLPVCLGMLLADITNKDAHKKAEEISLDIGKFLQIQDDFIDCFSDESITGKAGTDIQEGKCSWLAVAALQRCNREQLQVFEKCYGSKNPDEVQQIKQLYEEMELPRIYREEEQALYEAIVFKTKSLDQYTDLSPKLFLKLIDSIYRRKQ